MGALWTDSEKAEGSEVATVCQPRSQAACPEVKGNGQCISREEAPQLFAMASHSTAPGNHPVLGQEQPSSSW